MLTGLALCACKGLFPFWSPAFRSVSGLYLCYCESVSLVLLGSFRCACLCTGPVSLVLFCSGFEFVTTRVSRCLLVISLDRTRYSFTWPVGYWSVVGSGLHCTASQLDPRRRVPCVFSGSYVSCNLLCCTGVIGSILSSVARRVACC